ncbi:O-antigen polysaccharide polymerase Wzy [Flavobacterium frigidarium]|uniref:O-antigen polysaccharide polymerase Wzy n=1 Tax=Flavobacterium frigidarium TaxID=99286 RepID=A0ABV4KCU6_9FLAO
MLRATFFFIISLWLYYNAPDYYSYDLCLLYLSLFSINAFLTVQANLVNKNYLNFHLIFAVSFLFVNFIYPVFLYPIQVDYFAVFDRFPFNENIITVSTALALLGYNSYSLGSNLVPFNRNNVSNSFNFRKPTVNYLKLYEKFIFILGLLFLLILIMSVWKDLILRKADAFFSVHPAILVMNQIFINLVILINFYTIKFEKWSKPLMLIKKSPQIIYVLIYLSIFVITGDRGSAIQTVLVILFAYSLNIKVIKPLAMASIIAVGMVSLTFMSYFRSKDGGSLENVDNLEVRSSFDFAMDLIVTNRNLYAGYEYVAENGVNYGQGTIYYLFSPIPFLPTYISNLIFDAPPAQLTSAFILSDDADASYGLGTNLVIDLYMQFGTFGVVFFLFACGFLVSYFDFKSRNNFNLYMVSAFLFSFSIYMPRSTLFDVFRYLSWAFLMYYLFIFLFNSSNSDSEKNFNNK